MSDLAAVTFLCKGSLHTQAVSTAKSFRHPIQINTFRGIANENAVPVPGQHSCEAAPALHLDLVPAIQPLAVCFCWQAEDETQEKTLLFNKIKTEVKSRSLTFFPMNLSFLSIYPMSFPVRKKVPLTFSIHKCHCKLLVS